LTHTCVALTSGLGQCWGAGSNGQLGNGITANPVPYYVAGLQNAVDVTASFDGNYSCARLSDGTARCWGANTFGGLGDGTTATRSLPVVVSGLGNAVQMSAGQYHTCAVLTDGTARCWGYNGNGGLGDGTTTARSTPTLVANVSGVATIAAGYRHSCAVLTNGTAKCWGDNGNGEIGDGTLVQRRKPLTRRLMARRRGPRQTAPRCRREANRDRRRVAPRAYSARCSAAFSAAQFCGMSSERRRSGQPRSSLSMTSTR
jgi:alpha-tubulin suppressor-like RCC1 family protein